MADDATDTNAILGRISEVIEPARVNAYLDELDVLWRELLNLNSYVGILERLAEFRWDLLGSDTNRFWNLTFSSMSENCITILWRTCVDTDKKAHTLAHMKKSILRNIVDGDFRGEPRSHLKRLDFTKSAKQIGERINTIRHNYIAHLNRDRNVRPSKQQLDERKIMLTELREMVETVNGSFDAICLCHKRSLNYGACEPNRLSAVGEDPQLYINKLLDQVAQDSRILNMPEQQPGAWTTYRSMKLSDEDVEVINTYRAKFGLPAV